MPLNHKSWLLSLAIVLASVCPVYAADYEASAPGGNIVNNDATGIEANNSSAGSITITNNAEISTISNIDGINTDTVDGVTSITVNDDITAAQVGVYATSVGGGITINLSTGSTVSSVSTAAVVAITADGDIDINNNGDVSGVDMGVYAESNEGNINIIGSGEVKVDAGCDCGSMGIYAAIYNNTEADINIEQAGNIWFTGSKSDPKAGIVTNNSGNTTGVTNITTTGEIYVDSSENTVGISVGIFASRYVGTGDTTINANIIRLIGDYGIGIWTQASGGSDTFITANGIIDGGYNGIEAYDYDLGSVTIITNAAIGSVEAIHRNGIRTELADGDTNITTNNVVISDTNDAIDAVANGLGNITITNNAKLTGGSGANGNGIDIKADTGNVDLNVNADIYGGDAAIEFTVTSGNVDIDIVASATLDGGINGVTSGIVTLNNIGTINGLLDITNSVFATSVFANTGLWNAYGGSSYFAGALNNSQIIDLQNDLVTDVIYTGDLIFNSGSIVKIDVDNVSLADAFVVAGTVTLDGTLEVKANTDVFDYQLVTGIVYGLIDNDGVDVVAGSFDPIVEDYAFLSYVVDTTSGDGNDVSITLIDSGDPDFTPFSFNPNQSAAATAINNYTYSGAEGTELLKALYGLSNDAAKDVIIQLSGEDLAAVNALGGGYSAIFRDALLNRLAKPTTGQLGAIGYTNGNIEAEPQILLPNIWAKSLVSRSSVAKGSGATDISSIGLTLVAGADVDLGNGWTIGAGAGTSAVNFSTYNAASKASSLVGHLAAYAGWGAQQADQIGLGLVSALDYNLSAYSSSRQIDIGGLTKTAVANYSGQSWGGSLKARYGFETDLINKNSVISPLVGLSFSRLANDAFTETGAGGLNISASSAVYNQFSSLIGLEWAGQNKLAEIVFDTNVTLDTSFSVAWKHEFGDVNVSHNYQLQNSPTLFAAQTASVARNSVAIKAMATMALSQSVTASLAASGELSRTSLNLGAEAGIRLKF